MWHGFLLLTGHMPKNIKSLINDASFYTVCEQVLSPGVLPCMFQGKTFERKNAVLAHLRVLKVQRMSSISQRVSIERYFRGVGSLRQIDMKNIFRALVYFAFNFTFRTASFLFVCLFF